MDHDRQFQLLPIQAEFQARLSVVVVWHNPVVIQPNLTNGSHFLIPSQFSNLEGGFIYLL